MFALLEHTTDAGVHWDLLVDVEGAERLWTWRLQANPLAAAGEIVAERIGDHRALYLDFEGEISGGRGTVQPLDRGPAVVAMRPNGIGLLLEGERLHGAYEIVLLDAGTRFRAVGP